MCYRVMTYYWAQDAQGIYSIICTFSLLLFQRKCFSSSRLFPFPQFILFVNPKMFIYYGIDVVAQFVSFLCLFSPQHGLFLKYFLPYLNNCTLYSVSLSSGSDVSTQAQLLSACTHSLFLCAQFYLSCTIYICIWQISVLRHCQKIVRRSIVVIS